MPPSPGGSRGRALSVCFEPGPDTSRVFQLRFPAPTRVRGQVEQDILRRYLAAAPAVSDPGPVSG
jgi:hypothetical protein